MKFERNMLSGLRVRISMVRCARQNRYTRNMELQLTPETEAKLNDLALRTHRGTDELLRETVEHLVTYNDWFEQKANRSMTAVERGDVLSNKEVRSWLDLRERS